MHIKSTITTFAVAAGLLTGAPLFAQHEHAAAAQAAQPAGAGKLIRITDKDAAWAAKARKGYPLNVCVASGEKLGGMGDSAEYIYRVAGKPDRLVVFCCDGCEDDFMKDPAQYLKKIDDAAAAKQTGGTAGKAHQH